MLSETAMQTNYGTILLSSTPNRLVGYDKMESRESFSASRNAAAAQKISPDVLRNTAAANVVSLFQHTSLHY